MMVEMSCFVMLALTLDLRHSSRQERAIWIQDYLFDCMVDGEIDSIIKKIAAEAIEEGGC